MIGALDKLAKSIRPRWLSLSQHLFAGTAAAVARRSFSLGGLRGGSAKMSRIGRSGKGSKMNGKDMELSDGKHFVLASGNENKLREFTELLEPVGIAVEPADAEALVGVRETGASFVENALIKARAVCGHTSRPVIADDSGLVVPTLKGEPGVYSARYAGEEASDKDNNRKLLEQLMGHKDRGAYFYCIIVLMSRADDPCPLIFSGRWDGEIARSPSGQSGFGYDPLFYVRQFDQTAAEMGAQRKNAYSHRGRAARQLLLHLSQTRAGALVQAAVAGEQASP